MSTDIGHRPIHNIITSWIATHGPVRCGLDEQRSVSLMLDYALSADLIEYDTGPSGPTGLIYCKTSEWDSEILGVKVGRFSFLSPCCKDARIGNNALISRFLSSAKTKCFDLLIGRVDTRDIPSLHSLQKAGFDIMDSLVTLTRKCVPTRRSPAIRPYIPSDGNFLAEIGRKSFRTDHYHADPRLSSSQCDYLYSQWVRNACASRANAVFVAEVDRIPSGFIACLTDSEETNHPRHGIIDLIAVDPTKRGRGLGSELVSTALGWFHAQGVTYAEVGTQISNIQAIRLYDRLGFKIFRSVYTLHGWPVAQATSEEDMPYA